MRRLTTASREKSGLTYARSWADYDRLSVVIGAKEFIAGFVGNKARLFIAGQDETGRAVVTLTHEALLRAWPRLVRWLMANSEMLQVKAAVAGATNEWVKAKKDPSYLLPRGLQLEKAKQAVRDGYLEMLEVEFVQASIQAERKTIVRRRLVLAALFGVITAAGGAAIQYGWQRYDQGHLSIDSNEPTARVQIDDLQLGLPVTNLAIRSGQHTLRAFADGDIDRTQSVDIERGMSVPVVAHFWLENGLGWKYTSPSVQGGLSILPDPSGGPSIIAHNEISQIIFLSTADGSVVKTIATPTGNWRAFRSIDLGGDVGNVVVSGLDQENSGPELLVIRGTAPPQVLWSWKGPATGYGTPHPGNRSDLLVAGRDGKVYVLDGKTGMQLDSFTVSDQPLAMPPSMLAWQDGQDTIITLLLRPGDPNRLADTQPNLIGMSLRLEGRVPLWRRDLGGGWNPSFLSFQIAGHPQVFLGNDKDWQMIDLATGAPRSRGTFPAPLVAGPAVADIEGNGNPDLVFEFADTSQQMVAVNPANGVIVWHGPAGLNPRSQPRGLGSNILRTSTGALLVLTEDGLAAVDPHSGQIVWRAPGVSRGVLIGDWDGDGTNEILVTISGVGLRCLDEAGRERWTLRLSDDVEPWALIKSKDGGARDILIHRHASLIGLVHGPRMLWQANATAAIQANPVIAHDAQGNAIVIDTAQWGNDVYLRAFDGTFGNILWSTKDNLSDNRGATLADLDGTGQSYVVVVALPVRGNRLLVYRAADGKQVRDQPIALNTWLACAPAVADFRGIGKSDVAFSTWDDRSIVMVDGRSGEILWRFQVGASTMGGVASADLDGDGLPDVIAATLDGNVYALRGKDGSLLWKTPIPGGSWSVPLIATLDPKMPPYVLVTTVSGGLYVINSHTGEMVWSPSISQAKGREIVTMNDLKVSGHATVVSDADRAIILAPMGAVGVVAFDWVSKTELWRSPVGFPVLTTPAPVELTGQRGRGIVVAAGTGDVWTLSLADGKPLWHTQFPAKTVDADPVVADLDGDGIPDILVAGFDFSLRAINGVGTAIAHH
jgi:outer membrane protein assembly factor BamB